MKQFVPMLMIIPVTVFALLLAMPALAAPALPAPTASAQVTGPIQAPFFQVTPEELSQLLLGFVGVALSVAFKYIPKWKEWFDGFSHQGLLMLGFVVIAGGIYFALSCSPWAEFLKIQITCDVASVFLLLQAIVYIAIGNQLAYLYLPDAKSKARKGVG